MSRFPRKIKLTLFVLIFPLIFHAQSLTGLWVGTVESDSTVVRKDQSFEIALTEYRGKVYGYSRNEFIVDDVLYYIVKRVKGTIEGNICEVTDDEVLSHNFPRKPDRNVRVTNTFRRKEAGDAWILDGTWKTNQTKKLYQLTGKVSLTEEKDLTASKIFPHLEELKLANDVAFYKERNDGQPVVKIAKPERISSSYVANRATMNSIAENISTANQTVANDHSLVKGKETLSNIPGNSTPVKNTTSEETREELVAIDKLGVPQEKTSTANMRPDTITKRPVANSTAQQNTAALNTSRKISNSEQASLTNNKRDDDRVVMDQSSREKQTDSPVKKEVANNIPQLKTGITNKPVTTVKEEPATVKAKPLDGELNRNSPNNNDPTKSNTGNAQVTKEPIKQTVSTPLNPSVNKPSLDVTLRAAIVEGRKSEFSQQVNFRTDSLQIALYDNGEIDGDTVSIYMNGEVIMAKQGLKSSAIRKTIYIRPGVDEEFTLVLFAENLGKYPPNTGLLVVRDGDDIYNLRFSSDFQKNAGIIFKRKK